MIKIELTIRKGVLNTYSLCSHANNLLNLIDIILSVSAIAIGFLDFVVNFHTFATKSPFIGQKYSKCFEGKDEKKSQSISVYIYS